MIIFLIKMVLRIKNTSHQSRYHLVKRPHYFDQELCKLQCDEENAGINKVALDNLCLLAIEQGH
jgi:hypothetical protein